MQIPIPFSDTLIPVSVPDDRIAFIEDLPKTDPLPAWEEELDRLLDHPTAGEPLSAFLRPSGSVLLLVEDQTRHTPVSRILPVLLAYLNRNGVPDSRIRILIAPGTHRILTDEEIQKKIGPETAKRIRVLQHDYRDPECLADLGTVEAAGIEIPVRVNRAVLEADTVIGLGNIIPHPNAGFSGGAKILDPGCCGRETVSGTHMAAALLGFIPLGVMENDCRSSMEEVASRAGLNFIVNVVLNSSNEVIRLVTGEPVLAHRAGCMASREAFGIPIPKPADILISCSYPYDSDFWQCEKAMTTGNLAVRKDGILILAAPCLEGLAHNHDDLLLWTQMSCREVTEAIRKADPSDPDLDIVAAGIAMGANLVREKVRHVFLYAPPLSADTVEKLGYVSFPSLQEAIDEALRLIPDGSVGVLLRGGDCLPIPQAD